jgi:hypothetical protein
VQYVEALLIGRFDERQRHGFATDGTPSRRGRRCGTRGAETSSIPNRRLTWVLDEARYSGC